MKKTSITDIATGLGLSKTTVSFVLNGKGDEKKIPVRTQKRIMEMAGKMNYQPDHVAQSLKTGKTHTIGYLVPDIANPFFARIGRTIEDLVMSHGYQLIIGSTDENSHKEDRLIRTFVSKKVDGLIIASTNIRGKYVSGLIRDRFPLVFFDREEPAVKANYVVVENRQSMKEAVRDYLVNEGRKRIGLLSITPEVYSLDLRIRGFLDAVSNLPQFNDTFIRTVDYGHIKQSTQEEMAYLLKRKEVDAVVFTNNLIATRGLWVLNRYYPERINSLKLLSFDDTEIFDFARPGVTSLAQPQDEIARQTVEILLKNMEDPHRAFERIILNTSIIDRK